MNRDTKKFKIALWGLGTHAKKNVLPAISICNSLKFAGIYTRNKKNAELAKNFYGGNLWHSSSEMLNDRSVDIVYISTPTALHFSQIKKALKAGKHVICDKALTDNSSKSVSLVEYANNNQLLLCEAFMFFYHPQFIKIAQLTKSSDFGEITNISCYFCIPKLENPGFRTSKELGGGAFLDLGSYTVCLISYLLKDYPNDMKVEFIYDENQVDTEGIVYLKFNSCHVYLNWGYNRPYIAETTIFGEKQTLYADKVFSKRDDLHSKVYLRNNFGEPTVFEVEPANSFVKMFEACIKSIISKDSRQDMYKMISRQARMMKSIQNGVLINGKS
jgi:NDP-hexose-3-ketoreductase